MAEVEPTLEKTWEFRTNQIILGDTGTGGNCQNDRRRLLFAVKEDLIDGGLFTVPGIIKSSSNGVTASAADNITLDSHITFATSEASARSWWVTSFPGLGVELLIDCVHNATGDRGNRINAYISDTPYSLAGTTTARPTTAGTEIQLCTRTSSTDGTWDGTAATTTARTYVYHILQSDDGEEICVIITYGGVMVAWWRFGKFGNPVVAPTHNWYAFFSPRQQTETEIATSDTLNDVGVGRFYMLTNANATVSAKANIPVAELRGDHYEWETLTGRRQNSYSNTLPLQKLQIVSDTVGWKMVCGDVKDMFIGMNNLGHARLFPNTKDWIAYGLFIMPWDGGLAIPS